MTVENIALLEIILDAVALFFGGLAIAGVIMLRRSRVHDDQEVTLEHRHEQFNDMLVELVQQTERTFQKVTDALREERESLQGTTSVMPEKPVDRAVNNVTTLVDVSRRQRKRGPRRGKRKQRVQEERSADNRYSEVVELARKGMSKLEIADNVALPRSEIELIMELNSVQ